MKALVLERYNEFVYAEVPTPTITGDRDVLIRVKAVAVCGSDVHGMDGSTGRRRPPLVMGHEASGVIEAIGSGVRGFSVGDRVTFDSTIYCGECFHCRRGEPNLCDDRRVLGVSCAEYKQDGAFAEYVIVPDRILYRLPAALDFVSAAMTEPLAVAAHAARIAACEPGESVAVIGAGLIGLLIVQVLRANTSGRIIAVDLDPSRLETAKRFGADESVIAGPEAAEAVRQLTANGGVDTAFEAVGTTPSVATAIGSLRKGGTAVLVGNLKPTIEVPLQSIVTRQLTVKGSCAISGEYPFAIDLLSSGKVDAKALVSAVAPLSEGASWFNRLYAKEPGLLKVVLQP